MHHESENEHRKIRMTKGVFLTALIILVFLTLLSSILLAVRLAEFIKRDQREVFLETNMNEQLELFGVQHENASGEITVSGADGQTVIAPGTSMENIIHLRNSDKIAIDYRLVTDISFTSEYVVPILVRMLDENGEYVIGDAETWVALHEIGAQEIGSTLLKGESIEYVFQWKWDFESGNDAHDTWLGTNADKENIGMAVKFDIYAEANTDIGLNGGIWESGLGQIILAGITVLVLGGTIIVLIVVAKKKNREQDPE